MENIDIEFALAEIEEHLIKGENQVVDIANYCMFIWSKENEAKL